MDEFVTTKEAGDLLGVDEATIRKWCIAGKLNARRIGGHRGIWLINRADLAGVKRSAKGRKASRTPLLPA